MTLFQNRYRIESSRLLDWDYASRGWYFVTVCTKDKKCSRGCALDSRIVLSEAGLIAETEMKALSTHYSSVILDRFVVMPNHVHAIVVIEGHHPHSPNLLGPALSTPGSAPSHPRGLTSLSAVVGGYKSGVSRACHRGGIPNFQWQSRYHDRILRSNASVNAVRDYIDHNPQYWAEDPDNAAGTARRDAASRVSTP